MIKLIEVFFVLDLSQVSSAQKDKLQILIYKLGFLGYPLPNPTDSPSSSLLVKVNMPTTDKAGAGLKKKIEEVVDILTSSTSSDSFRLKWGFGHSILVAKLSSDNYIPFERSFKTQEQDHFDYVWRLMTGVDLREFSFDPCLEEISQHLWYTLENFAITDLLNDLDKVRAALEDEKDFVKLLLCCNGIDPSDSNVETVVSNTNTDDLEVEEEYEMPSRKITSEDLQTYAQNNSLLLTQRLIDQWSNKQMASKVDNLVSALCFLLSKLPSSPNHVSMNVLNRFTTQINCSKSLKPCSKDLSSVTKKEISGKIREFVEANWMRLMQKVSNNKKVLLMVRLRFPSHAKSKSSIYDIIRSISTHKQSQVAQPGNFLIT